MTFIDPASQLGIPFWLIIAMTIWETIWTGFAMWRAAKLGHVVWFALFLLLNILAIPEIIYLAFTKKTVTKKISSNKKR